MNNRYVTIVLTALIVLPLGLCAGFCLGVDSTQFGRELLEAPFATEEPAEIDQPKTMARDHFQLEYPSNWSIDRKDDDFDIDQFFSIDTPGHSYVQFEIYQVDSDPSENIQHLLDFFRALIREPEEVLFDRWGQYDGVGVRLTGDCLGGPIVTRIFSHSSGELSFTVAESFDLEEKHDVKPGYDLIEKTFTLRLPAPLAQETDDSADVANDGTE